ncbi:YfiR family protein [Paraglaciecola sp. 20A4]|uniref:YfiR family protein n=1 Tax=Paraglaciecola sp. 20A4 TaxID=2687288 RepID=UPI003211DB74
MSGLINVNWVKGSLVFFVLFPSLLMASQELAKERKLKAAYLLNFTKYMNWPKGNNSVHQMGFHLCIHSDAPFYEFMQALIARHNQGNNNRRITINKILDAKLCHMAYFQTPIEQPLLQLEKAVIVLESQGVQQANSAIRFYTQAQRVRFEFDLAQLARAHVTASSELLKLAKIVKK